MQREAFLKLNWQKRRGYLQGELAKLPLTSIHLFAARVALRYFYSFGEKEKIFPFWEENKRQAYL
jgi:hypothetical protein